MPRILVIGSINMDLMLRMERLPLPGESLFGRDYAYGGGGKGANQAVAAAKLGAQTALLCRVGNDENGKRLIANLAACGVSDRWVTVDDNLPSGMAAILLEESANRIVVYPGANLGLLPEHLTAAMAERPDAVMLQFELQFETVIAAVTMAKQEGIMTVVDAGPARDFPLERIAGTDVLSPNEPETERLTGIFPDSEENIRAAAERLWQRAHPKFVVLKLGERGAALYDGKALQLYPAFQVSAVDTTAAGDAFTAGLALALTEGRTIEEAMHFAAAAGALAVTKSGATDSLPTRAEVEAFLKFQK